MPPEYPISHEIQVRLNTYKTLLQKWQPKINLVGESSLQELETRHFKDSLQLAHYIPSTAKTLYDLGSGAGFPGLVLALVRPDLKVHLIESDQRKCSFLQTVSRETGIKVNIHTSRIERLALAPPDIITARALAPLSRLLKLTDLWWKDNASIKLLFPKGEDFLAEIEAAKHDYTFDSIIYESHTDKSARILNLSHISAL